MIQKMSENKHEAGTQAIYKISPELARKFETLKKRYPQGQEKSALLPILHLVQADNGYLSVAAMDAVANYLNLLTVEVYEVATFYTMFHLKPVGNSVIEVCQTSSCWLRGADVLIKHLQEKLAIGIGQTTDDGRFTLKTVECLGACGDAPVCQIGQVYHKNLNIDKLDQIVALEKERKTHSRYIDPQNFPLSYKPPNQEKRN